MTNPVYPATLPGPLSGTFKQSRNDGIVRDTGEIGPGRKRRRTTRVLKLFSFTLRLSTAQKAAWETFYEITLNEGLAYFDWTLDGVTYTVEVLTVDGPDHVTAGVWDISLTLGEV